MTKYMTRQLASNYVIWIKILQRASNFQTDLTNFIIYINLFHENLWSIG
jgi:hypothetical protein